jgi:TPR repeat protein
MYHRDWGTRIETMSDEKRYAQALAEVRDGIVHQDLSAKAYVLAKGDPAQQEIEYLLLRVRQLKSAALSAQLEPENVIKWLTLLVRWALGAILILIACVALFALMSRQSYQPIDMLSLVEIAGLIGCPLLAFNWCWRRDLQNLRNLGTAASVSADPTVQKQDADALYAKAKMYYFGRGVPIDYAEAIRCYIAAGKSGREEGYLDAAYALEDHFGDEASLIKAARCRELASKGPVRGAALSGLSAMYEDGRGVEQNDAKAIQLLTAAAEAGDYEAQFSLALHYENGICVEKNAVEAARCYRALSERACPNAHCRLVCAQAQYELARRYRDGDGVEQNDVQAARWCMAAAEGGDIGAQELLGWMYANGRGVQQDSAEASRLLTAYATRIKNPTAGMFT